MKMRVLMTVAAGVIVAAQAVCAEDGPVVGIVEWQPYVPYKDKTEHDKTDLWAAIAFSPSTGKYGATCYWTSQDNASRAARESCNARDAKVVVLCCNGWCALALGEPTAVGDHGWGVGWAPDQEGAERFALKGARERMRGAKVVYSIDSRQMRFPGVIAYSTTTGRWGYSCGYGRSDASRAVQFCGDPKAEVIVGKTACCWMALATGDDRSAYGWGYAGNRVDAERNALEECRRRDKNAKVAASFCTNGVTH